MGERRQQVQRFASETRDETSCREKQIYVVREKATKIGFNL